MYTSGGGLHAEQKFIKENKDTLGDFTWLWINNSPCPMCANELIRAYANVQNKPVIAAAHFYFGEKKYGREAALRCLARMVTEGFTFKAFPWRVYQQFLSEPACKKDIAKALNSSKFYQKMQDMSKTVDIVNQYAHLDKTDCPY
jgi:hypothetical protein